MRLREEGLVGKVGIATHRVDVVQQLLDQPEVEVLHPLINRSGMGIPDGTAAEMAEAIRQVGESGRTVYAMKALAGGNLISEARASLNWVRRLPGVHSVAVGMLSEAEVDANTALFFREEEAEGTWEQLSRRTRRLVVLGGLCTGCGSCVGSCSDGALSLVNGRVVVDEARCVLCGYCAAVCPLFLIRVV